MLVEPHTKPRTSASMSLILSTVVAMLVYYATVDTGPMWKGAVLTSLLTPHTSVSLGKK